MAFTEHVWVLLKLRYLTKMEAVSRTMSVPRGPPPPRAPSARLFSDYLFVRRHISEYRSQVIVMSLVFDWFG